jgi:hypothetical protein
MAIVRKGVLTQGTKVWIEHGDATTPILTRMDCITSISLGDDSVNDIDDTCLEETDVKTSQPGLTTPGDGEIVIKTDPLNASHMTLLQLAENREPVKVYIGWSDGTTTPTLATNTVTLPTTRTFSSFDAILRISSPTFEADSLVEHKVAMKRQSKVTTIYKLSA